MAKAKAEQEPVVKEGLPFGRQNYILMGAALVAIILGYIFLGSGDITLAPILLVLGYVVLFPLGIIWGGKKKEERSEA